MGGGVGFLIYCELNWQTILFMYFAFGYDSLWLLQVPHWTWHFVYSTGP